MTTRAGSASKVFGGEGWGGGEGKGEGEGRGEKVKEQGVGNEE